MIPVVRRIACAELVVVASIGILIAVAYLDSPVVNDFFNPHAGYAIGLVFLALAVIVALLVVFFSIPSALAKLIAESAELTPGQVAVIVIGVLLLLAVAIAIIASMTV